MPGLTDPLLHWYVLTILVAVIASGYIGYLLARWRYIPLLEGHGRMNNGLTSKQFLRVSECLMETLTTLKLESRGQPLNQGRIERRFNRTLEQRLAIPHGTLNCEIRVFLKEDMYYVRIVDLFFTLGTITVTVPAEWIPHGIDDVQLVAQIT